ncbi:hypothetical protein P7K49_039219, partial [Saguinus oedipus]
NPRNARRGIKGIWDVELRECETGNTGNLAMWDGNPGNVGRGTPGMRDVELGECGKENP